MNTLLPGFPMVCVRRLFECMQLVQFAVASVRMTSYPEVAEVLCFCCVV